MAQASRQSCRRARCARSSERQHTQPVALFALPPPMPPPCQSACAHGCLRHSTSPFLNSAPPGTSNHSQDPFNTHLPRRGRATNVIDVGDPSSTPSRMVCSQHISTICEGSARTHTHARRTAEQHRGGRPLRPAAAAACRGAGRPWDRDAATRARVSRSPRERPRMALP